MVQSSAMELLRREMRVIPGSVPTGFDGQELEREYFSIDGECFLFHTECGMRIFYRKGEGVRIAWGEQTDSLNERLYLNGTTYAAVASINGFYPVHASAVAVDGKVHAFTGHSGAGKSTLIAELCRSGLPLFCDDTLILDLSGPQIMALPGHKQLKLWPDALALTGAEGAGEVWAGAGKVYAAPAGEIATEVLPLAELCFLEEGDPAHIAPLRGAERLARLQDDHYTAELWLGATTPDKQARFAQLARLAREVAMSRFVRPRDPAQFRSSARLVIEHLGQGRDDKGKTA
jgi:hypothetical protein